MVAGAAKPGVPGMKRMFLMRCMICTGMVFAICMNSVGPVLAGPAQDCFDTAVTQRQMNRCAASNLETERERLASILIHIRSGLRPESLRGFEASRQAWENWLELHCAWERDRAEGGSIAPLLHLECLADHTRMRRKRLEHLACTGDNSANLCEQE